MMKTMVPFAKLFQGLASSVLLVVLMLPLSGCVQEAEVTSNKDLVKTPALNATLADQDFAFPSRPPRLSEGKKVFQQNCLTCHASFSYDKVRDVRPIDTYLLLSQGLNGHPSFKKLSRDQRWEAVFYARYMGGGADIKTPGVDALFGANCAVCHGKKGDAEGSLHTGHGPHELGMAPVKNAFYPPPANFTYYPRVYNRTDDQLVKHISEGVYPSAMPSFLGREDKAKGVVFTEPVIRDLVKYVRKFSYENDLPQE